MKIYLINKKKSRLIQKYKRAKSKILIKACIKLLVSWMNKKRKNRINFKTNSLKSALKFKIAIKIKSLKASNPLNQETGI